MFFRKRRPNPMPMPPWMKWGVAGTILLVIAVNSSSPDTDLKHTLSMDAIKKHINIAPYKMAFNPQKDPDIEDIIPGEGPIILCGQNITMSYILIPAEAAPDNPAIEPITLTFQQGMGTAPLILERGITGMHVGGQRRISFTPAIKKSALVNKPSNEEKTPEEDTLISAIEIQLQQAEPDLRPLFLSTPEAVGLRLYDTKPGNGPAVLCGEEARIQLKIFDGQGMRIYDSSELANTPWVSLRIGEGQALAGLEQSIIGMQPGGKRTMIIPPAWQKPITTEHNLLVQTLPELHKLDLPRNTLIMADVELLPPQKPMSTPNPNVKEP